MTVWSVEKLELGDADDEVRKFFVRVKVMSQIYQQ